jgi:hypothetical protein
MAKDSFRIKLPNTSGVATLLAVRVPAYRLSGSARAGTLDGILVAA